MFSSREQFCTMICVISYSFHVRLSRLIIFSVSIVGSEFGKTAFSYSGCWAGNNLQVQLLLKALKNYSITIGVKCMPLLEHCTNNVILRYLCSILCYRALLLHKSVYGLYIKYSASL